MYRAHSDAFLSIVAAKMAVIHNKLRVCTEASKGVLGTSWPKMVFSMHGLVAGSAILGSPDFHTFANTPCLFLCIGPTATRIPVSMYSCIPVSLYPRIPVSSYPCIPVSLHPCIPVSLYPGIPVSLDPCSPVSVFMALAKGFVVKSFCFVLKRTQPPAQVACVFLWRLPKVL